MPITTESFGGAVWPPEVANELFNRALSGSPFAASLTRRQISHGSLVFPTVDPTGAAWRGELEDLPTLTLNDQQYVAVPRKLGGVVELSNESLSDATLNLAAVVADALRDSLGVDVDQGLLHGDGTGANRSACSASPRRPPRQPVGRRVRRGGRDRRRGQHRRHDRHAAQRDRREAARLDAQDRPLYPNGLAIAGLKIVGVPALEPGEVLVYDSSRVLFVTRGDVEVATSDGAAFVRDGTMLRVVVRVAVAVPTATRSIRKITVTP